MSQIDWSAIREEALAGFSLAALPPTFKVPALPHAVTRFVEKSNDPDVPLKELAGIIETDSGLTLELLRYVNSAFMGVRHKATNVQQALSLLGQRQTRTFIVSTGLQAAVKARQSKLINQGFFWNACLQKALFAREVAGLLKTDKNVAFAGALLQDYLLPIITNDLFDPYLDFVQNRSDYPECLCEFEQGQFGWDHAVAAAYLAHRWHLPDELVCCILLHHRGLKILADAELKRTPAAAVAVSGLLPDQLRQHYEGLESLEKLQELWSAFCLEDLAKKVDEMHEATGLGVHNDFPLWRRCRPVAQTEADFNDGSLKVSPAQA